eukprot:296417_1
MSSQPPPSQRPLQNNYSSSPRCSTGSPHTPQSSESPQPSPQSNSNGKTKRTLMSLQYSPPPKNLLNNYNGIDINYREPAPSPSLEVIKRGLKS